MEQFIGQLGLFAFNFVPKGWLPCDGRLLNIAQNQALYTLLGITFGGNGSTTFGIPDLRGRAPLGAGNGPNLTPRALGATSGQGKVVLTQQTIPAHTHALLGCSAASNASRPAGTLLGTTADPAPALYKQGATQTGTLNAGSLATAGASQGHENCQPYLPLIWAIATTGIFPSRG